jgi:hypothetical protein
MFNPTYTSVSEHRVGRMMVFVPETDVPLASRVKPVPGDSSRLPFEVFLMMKTLPTVGATAGIVIVTLDWLQATT